MATDAKKQMPWGEVGYDWLGKNLDIRVKDLHAFFSQWENR